MYVSLFGNRSGRSVGNRNAVDFHTVTELNDKVWDAVKQFCFHQISPVRIYLDDMFRSLDLEGSVVGHVGRQKSGRVPGSCINLPV